MVTGPAPAWLSAWQLGPLSTLDALSRFDGLPGVGLDEVIGRWRGRSLPTGHPLDGLLEALGWHGKAVESPDQVHALLFRRRSGRVVALDPALMPVGIALAWPAFARSPVVRAAFAASGPILRARRPTASLDVRGFRGKRGAALVYEGQPIVDHLRRVDADRMVGLMERRRMARPFFFVLEREADG